MQSIESCTVDINECIKNISRNDIKAFMKFFSSDITYNFQTTLWSEVHKSNDSCVDLEAQLGAAEINLARYQKLEEYINRSYNVWITNHLKFFQNSLENVPAQNLNLMKRVNGCVNDVLILSKKYAETLMENQGKVSEIKLKLRKVRDEACLCKN